jgi:hypothetical protein
LRPTPNYTNIDTSRIAYLAFSVESQLLEFRVALAHVDTTESSGAIKPFTAVLEIRSGRSVWWTRNTENIAPPLVFLQGNETVEQAVKMYERPHPEFFSMLQIPP